MSDLQTYEVIAVYGRYDVEVEDEAALVKAIENGEILVVKIPNTYVDPEDDSEQWRLDARKIVAFRRISE